MFNDLLTFEGLDEACESLFQFSGVTMLRDFGPLDKGQQIACIAFDLEEGLCSVYSEDALLNKFPFTLTAPVG